MDERLLGLYWHQRALTLRDYANYVRGLLLLLRSAHPVFDSLEWVGDGRRKPIKVASNFTGFDELVYQNHRDKSNVLGPRNPDGTPNWESGSLAGYGMIFNTGRSSKQGGVTVGVWAGATHQLIPNSITVNYPDPSCDQFQYHEFYNYLFNLDLLKQLIHYSMPDTGLVTSRHLSEQLYPEGPPLTGWLTYFASQQCADMVAEFETEQVDSPGILFTLGRDTFLTTDSKAISRSLCLRDKLKDRGVI